jgi:hypothetical protein
MPVVREVDPSVAVRVAEVEELTPLVVTAKLTLELPETTVTEAGTLAAEELLDSKLTTVPEGPAGPVRITVPNA